MFVGVCRSQDNLQESILSFHHTFSRGETSDWQIWPQASSEPFSSLGWEIRPLGECAENGGWVWHLCFLSLCLHQRLTADLAYSAEELAPVCLVAQLWLILCTQLCNPVSYQPSRQ